jgi:hypothetical protein
MKFSAPKAFVALALLAGSLAPAFASATPADAGFVPKDWYTPPEEGGAPANSMSPFSVPSPKLDASLGRIFSAQRDALTAVQKPSVTFTPPANMPSDWVPWRFAAFASDLSVTASGLLGVLSFKGTPSITVIWQKREPKTKVVASAAAEPAGNVPVFRISDNPADLETQVDAIYQTALASGHVKKTKGLRDRIHNMVGNFHDMTVAVNQTPAGGEWYASRLRVDLEISASGQVQWGTVGGDLKVRLEWYRIQPKSADPALHAAPAVADGPSPLRDLVTAMSEDLISVSQTTPNPHFDATTFYVGLGISAGGNIGVVKASAQAIGYLYFSHAVPAKTKVFTAARREFSPASWMLIENSPSARSLDYARATGVHMQLHSAVQGHEQAEYVIDRGNFREGLKQAMQMGDYFSRIADQNGGSEWGVSDIKPGFTMSVGGKLDLVTLTGLVTAQIIFQNKNL